MDYNPKNQEHFLSGLQAVMMSRGYMGQDYVPMGVWDEATKQGWQSLCSKTTGMDQGQDRLMPSASIVSQELLDEIRTGWEMTWLSDNQGSLDDDDEGSDVGTSTPPEPASPNEGVVSSATTIRPIVNG